MTYGAWAVRARSDKNRDHVRVLGMGGSSMERRGKILPPLRGERVSAHAILHLSRPGVPEEPLLVPLRAGKTRLLGDSCRCEKKRDRCDLHVCGVLYFAASPSQDVHVPSLSGERRRRHVWRVAVVRLRPPGQLRRIAVFRHPAETDLAIRCQSRALQRPAVPLVQLALHGRGVINVWPAIHLFVHQALVTAPPASPAGCPGQPSPLRHRIAVKAQRGACASKLPKVGVRELFWEVIWSVV